MSIFRDFAHSEPRRQRSIAGLNLKNDGMFRTEEEYSHLFLFLDLRLFLEKSNMRIIKKGEKKNTNIETRSKIRILLFALLGLELVCTGRYPPGVFWKSPSCSPLLSPNHWLGLRDWVKRLASERLMYHRQSGSFSPGRSFIKDTSCEQR